MEGKTGERKKKDYLEMEGKEENERIIKSMKE